MGNKCIHAPIVSASLAAIRARRCAAVIVLLSLLPAVAVVDLLPFADGASDAIVGVGIEVQLEVVVAQQIALKLCFC